MSASGPDYLDFARRTDRDSFIHTCKFPFLVGTDSLVKPRAPHRTVDFMTPDVTDLRKPDLLAPALPPQPGLVVLAVRKVAEAFSGMITIGRTANNDIVIKDVAISKFHAYFRMHESEFDLTDAGSRNGTWVGDIELPPKGAATVVRFGDHLRFGTLRFDFLDAGATWDRAHR